MINRILIFRQAQKELAALPQSAYEQIKRAVLRLATEPRPGQSRKLVSRDGWRLRVGHHRLIYDIDDTARTVTIVHVGHRRDVYR